MTVIPQHRVARRLAALWLLIGAVSLAVLLLRPGLYENERAALTVLLPLYFLGLPLTHLGLLASDKLRLNIIVELNYVPEVQAEGVLLWALLLVLGYVQWFLLLPWVTRKFAQLARFLFKRDAAS